MAKMKDRTGVRYGRLVALRRVGQNKSRNAIWLCKCDCGNDVEATSGSLHCGSTRSCGCLQKEEAAARQKTHGLSQTRAFKAWDNARRRCFVEKDKRFPVYGGRGITMDPRWREDFRNFYNDMGECPPGMTLERVDVDGHYEPGNCKWASLSEQANNRRTRITMEIGEERMCLAEYCRRTGESYSAIKTRIRRQKTRLLLVKERAKVSNVTY